MPEKFQFVAITFSACGFMDLQMTQNQMCKLCTFSNATIISYVCTSQDWGTNILLVRLVYIDLIILIVYVLKALINLYIRSEY